MAVLPAQTRKTLHISQKDIASPDENISDRGSVAPLRILFFDHTAELGGGEIALLNLVRQMDPQRFTPIVVLGAGGPLAEKLGAAGIDTRILSLAGGVAQVRKESLGLKTLLRVRDLAAVLEYIGRLARLMAEERIDIVHTNSLKADLIGGLAARLARRTLVWHIRDRIEDDYLPGYVAGLFRRLCRIIPHFVIANSNATLKTIRLSKRDCIAGVCGGVDPNARALVVHDGVSKQSHRQEEMTARSDPIKIGLVGRISPWKGQDVFLQAAKIVHDRYPSAQFQIIGAALFDEQAYEREVRELSHSLGLDDCVKFTGFRSDVPELIAGLDILAHASTTGEPFGQVVVEGMIAGKPVVATSGGGVPEIVVDGITGILVPMNDAEALAAGLLRILDLPDRGREMGRQGRQRALTHFTVELTAKRVAGVYNELARRRLKRPLPRPSQREQVRE